jgi:glucan biosynthesis protein C
MAGTVAVAGPPARTVHGRELGLDYLRGSVTFLVIVAHSALAYATLSVEDTRHTFIPVVDSSQTSILNFVFYFIDNFPMCLLFLVSGLFVLPGLRSHGVFGYVRQRLIRLGIPFAVSVVFIVPIAYYFGWLASGHPAGYFSFWKLDIASGWSCGPQWTIWELLLFDFLAAAFFLVIPPKREADERPWKPSPVLCFIGMFLGAALLFIPLAIRFDITAQEPLALALTGWRRLVTKPFYFQAARVLMYLFWFAAGVFLGGKGLESGPLGKDAPLVRRWPFWTAWAVFCYCLFFGLFMGRFNLASQLNLGEKAGTVLFGLVCVLSSTACVFGSLAFFRGAVHTRRPWMDSFTRSAYIIYLIHYGFVTWIQYRLLTVALPPLAKFAIAVIGTTAVTWAIARVLLRIPGLKHIV